MASSRILDLVKTISEGSVQIHNFLQQNALPFPSFEPGAPESLPLGISKAQDDVLDASIELQELLMGSVNAIHAYGNAQQLVSLNAIQRFDIAGCLSPGQTATFAEIAAQTGLSESTAKSLLRHAMTMRIFQEPEKGIVAHTSRSMLLRQPRYRNFLRVGMEEMTPAALMTVDAITKWPMAQEPTQTGFSLANHTEKSLYEVLAGSPARAERFADTMTIFTSGSGFEVHHAVDGFPWPQDKPATIVDIGGSNGNVAMALARRYELLTVIIQDLESTVTGAAHLVPNELADRVRFMSHNFFQPQPVVADVYFFRWIFHNWSDKYCIQILRSLIPALRPNARIFINDGCMPEPGTIPFWRERNLRTLNLDMISILNGRERDEDEWRTMLTQADTRFCLLHIKQPEGSNLAMIEVKWEG